MALQRQSRKSAVQRAAEHGPLAAVIATRRNELGLSQAELGDLAGVSYRIVHHLESGKPGTSLDRVVAVLDTLGLHLEIVRGPSAHIEAGDEIAQQYSMEPPSTSTREPRPEGPQS